MPVLGSKQRCWAICVGVGSYTLGLGSRRRGRLYTSAFGSMLVRRRWHCVVHTGVGSYRLALGPTQWHWAVNTSIPFIVHEVMRKK
jgi:hypothetical protein